MLDTFCGSISDEAQLRISLTLGKLALPVWEDYFTKNPAAIDQVNALISDANRVNGGLEKIDINFPKRAIEKTERSLAAAKKKISGPTCSGYEKRCYAFSLVGNLHAAVTKSAMG